MGKDNYRVHKAKTDIVLSNVKFADRANREATVFKI